MWYRNLMQNNSVNYGILITSSLLVITRLNHKTTGLGIISVGNGLGSASTL